MHASCGCVGSRYKWPCRIWARHSWFECVLRLRDVCVVHDTGAWWCDQRAVSYTNAFRQEFVLVRPQPGLSSVKGKRRPVSRLPPSYVSGHRLSFYPAFSGSTRLTREFWPRSTSCALQAAYAFIFFRHRKHVSTVGRRSPSILLGRALLPRGMSIFIIDIWCASWIRSSLKCSRTLSWQHFKFLNLNWPHKSTSCRVA